jgi:hypothetical protein
MTSILFTLQNVATSQHKADVIFAVKDVDLEIVTQNTNDSNLSLLLEGEGILQKIKVLADKLKAYNPTYQLSTQSPTKSIDLDSINPVIQARTTTSQHNLAAYSDDAYKCLLNMVRDSTVIPIGEHAKADTFECMVECWPLMVIYFTLSAILLIMKILH